MINLVDTITKMNYARNEGGDFVYSTQETLACRFREINELTNTGNREQLNCDAMVHFHADAGVSLNDIFCYNGEYYRVDTIVKARKLYSTDVQFLKCGLIRHRQVS